MSSNRHTRDLIHEAIDTFDTREEFDSLIIASMTGLSIAIVRHILSKMNLSRRRLSDQERKEWRSTTGSQAKFVYQRHAGSNPNKYEIGIKARPRTNPTGIERLNRQRNDEECATCPEFDICQGMISPCPRYPDQENAPITDIMKLEDF